MGIQSAMNSAVSGLSANGNAMSVIGNNISNSNTTGYKANRALFSDILAQEVSSAGGNSQIGRGVNTATVDTDFSQGTFKGTSSNTDLAVDGPGLFIMGEPGTDTVNYTRDGAFEFNPEGNLVNATGQRVQGYRLNENENPVGDLTDVQVNTNSSIPAQQTSEVTTITNLNADTKTNTSGTFGGDYENWTGADTVEFDVNVGNLNLGTVSASGAATDDAIADNIGSYIDTNWSPSSTGNPSGAYNDLQDVGDWAKFTDGSGDTILTLTRNANNGFDFETQKGANFSITNYSESAGNTGRRMNVSSTALGNQNTLESGNTSSAYAFDSDNPAVTSNFSTSVTSYDSLGDDHTITTYFKKVSNNTWDFHFMAPANEISGGPSTGMHDVGSGTVNFTSSGEIDSITGNTTNTITWNNGSADQQISYNFDDLTQYAGQSEVVRQEQDGNASGNMVDVSVDPEGNVIANYSNGESQKEYRLGLAQFSNPGGLKREGDNLYSETDASGDPAIGMPGSSVGTIRSNSLEQANVDIANQFTKMITTQRAYQANSRTISTTKDMLQEVINLTR